MKLPRLYYNAVVVCAVVFLLSFISYAQSVHDNPRVEDALEKLYGSQQLDLREMSHAGTILAVIETRTPNATPLLLAMQSLGARVVESTTLGLIKAWLPLGQVDRIANLPQVRYVRRPNTPFVPQAYMKNESFSSNLSVSEGVSLLGATPFHNSGILGSGVRVAVIDLGFESLSYVELASELSAENIITTDYTNNGIQTITPHGTAVAELIYDMAPKATLYLMKIGDEVDLANAVEDCIREHVDIIVHSAGWFNTNFGNGTGVVSEIANRAINAGILWVNAAGNMAQKHWLGPCIDTNKNGWAEFTNGSETLQMNVSAPTDIQVFLTWDDWPIATCDLDLFLVDSAGNVISMSQSRQSGNEEPTEDIDISVPAGLYFLKVRIHNLSRPVSFEIYSINSTISPAVARSSIPAPGNISNVITVGALNIRRWRSGPLEDFSSQGPTNDGRSKPDITGPDGVTTFVYEHFIGTSAAAPHVAGAAALILARERATNMNTAIGGEALKRILMKDAIDMGPKGIDFLYGAGRCQLILQHVTAERSLDTPFVGNQVVAGGQFAVNVTVQMPASLLGGMKLEEQLPENFVVQSVENGGTTSVNNDKRKILWYWPIVERGEERHVAYRVHVPASVPAGIYKLTGVVNGSAVHGSQEISVISPLTIPGIIAHFRPDIAKIDLRLDNKISFQQLDQAVEWWIDANTPPCTSTPISLADMETVLASYLSSLPVHEVENKVVHKVDRLEMDYSLSSFEVGVGGQIVVHLAMKAREQLLGLGLEQDLPAKWSIIPINNDGAVFRVAIDSTGNQHAQWLWTEKLRCGVLKRIQFRLNASDEAAPATVYWLKATASSRSPCFTQDTAMQHITIGTSTGKEALQLATEPYSISSSAEDMIFRIHGNNIEEIRVLVYSLSGLLIFDSNWEIGVDFQWGLCDQEGRTIPNGVYLYQVSVRGGGNTRMGPIRTILVLR